MTLQRELKCKGGPKLTKRSRVLEHPCLSDEDQKKPCLVIDVLRKFYTASSGVSGRGKNFFVYFKRKISRSLCGKRKFIIKEHNGSMKILQTNL